MPILDPFLPSLYRELPTHEYPVRNSSLVHTDVALPVKDERGDVKADADVIRRKAKNVDVFMIMKFVDTALLLCSEKM
jgi:hypothetical protein